MKLQYTKKNILRGALIYTAGDTIASLILHQFLWTRMAGMMAAGATFYSIEIPNYFRWIDNKTGNLSGWYLAFYKTGLAILYFNPLWIARHMAIIKIFSGEGSTLSWDLLRIAGWSFLVNIPLSLIGNFIIQNRISTNWRFFSSAVFSALMAVYYALSVTFF